MRSLFAADVAVAVAAAADVVVADADTQEEEWNIPPVLDRQVTLMIAAVRY